MSSSGNAVSNGNGTAHSNGNTHGNFQPADGISGRWEGVVRPYSQAEVRLDRTPGLHSISAVLAAQPCPRNLGRSVLMEVMIIVAAKTNLPENCLFD